MNSAKLFFLKTILLCDVYFLFINGLLDKVIENSYYKASNDTVTSLKGLGRIRSLSEIRCCLRLHTSIRPEENQENLSQVSLCPGRESKYSPIEHKSSSLPLELTHWMWREIALYVHAWLESQLKCPAVRDSLFRSVSGGRRHLCPCLGYFSTS